MEFGSEYVYDYDDTEFEYVSDDELAHGMHVSDSESEEDFESLKPLDDRVKGSPGKGGHELPPLPPLQRLPLPPPPPHRSSSHVVTADSPVYISGIDKAAKNHTFRNVTPVKKKKNAHHWRSAESAPPPPPQQHGIKKVRRADTNIVSIKFDKLISPSNMHTGDAVYCSSCQAILSNLSTLSTEGEDKIWECEFCGERNCMDIDDEEIPKDDDVTYMLEPALSTMTSGVSGMDESLVIFCVDISGSMCVTTEVPGKVNLRGSQAESTLREFNTDHSNQYFPNQSHNVTYVSRLQAVQAAVDHQLQEMAKDHPRRRIALITFNNEVTILGDGHGTPVTVTGDKLKDKEELLKIGKEMQLPQPIVESRKLLGEKVFGLEEGGQTALGPALVIATTMAGAHPGSKVIFCTDGMANTGLGKLDNVTSDIQTDEVEKFYKGIGENAAENGVSVSVISIKGTDCKLVQLGKVADLTGGQVNIVDPLKLTQEFSTILAGQIIATNVVATFLLHKELFFSYEDKEESKIVQKVGNVTAETQILFEYGLRTAKKEEEKPENQDSDANKEKDADTEKSGASGGEIPDEAAKMSEKKVPRPDKLPFQLQIQYTDIEGNKALRVLTQSRPVTRDRNLAERRMNLNVVGKHAAQTSAQIALDGCYTDARTAAMMHQRMAWRYTNFTEEGSHERDRYKKYFNKIQKMENQLNVAQQSERARHGTTYSDDEDDEEIEKEESKPKSIFSSWFGKKKIKKQKARSRDTTDTTAELMYNLKAADRLDDD